MSTITHMEETDNSDTSITIDQYIKDYKHEYPKPTVFTDSYTVKKAKAFTLAPVVKHNGIAHAVESFRFKSLSEMRNFADEHEFILYQTHIEIKLLDSSMHSMKECIRYFNISNTLKPCLIMINYHYTLC